MSFLRASAVVIALFAVAGCTQSSYTISRVFDGQETLSSAAHWKILAQDTALRIVDYLEGKRDASGEPLRGEFPEVVSAKPIYIVQADMEMPFSQAFHDNLTTAILDRGWTVVRSPEDTLVVQYHVQLIPRSRKVDLNAFPGFFTAIGYGLWAMTDLTAQRLLPAGAVFDAYYNAQGGRGAQVNITISLLDGDQYLLRKTNAYYVENADLAHFASNFPSVSPAPPVVQAATPPGVRTFNIVAE